ncbi:DNA-binding SARP family transcriptional activator [Streptomyces sp. TLI_235]|nr:AfsR/SARP family transcriptional regulator [Streptomyces sp. TLI_235]PBC75541.1 DNA-binding SARP family transcriptional activator [Streptomyces sp. TLI_235]
MDYQLLGPVEVSTAGRVAGLGGRRQQAALAALLLEAGRVVSVDRLTEVIWNDDAPETARAQVQTCVSTLRRKLLDDRIVSRYPGYAIEVAPERVDLAVYRGRVDAARDLLAQGRPEQAVASFQAALDLWRGPALSGVPGLAIEAARLEEERLAITEEMLETELGLGRRAALVGTLASLVSRHPLRERLRALLMRALNDSGRKAEALQQYREAHTLMVRELGVQPGAELQALFQRLLAADGGLVLAGSGRPLGAAAEPHGAGAEPHGAAGSCAGCRAPLTALAS